MTKHCRPSICRSLLLIGNDANVRVWRYGSRVSISSFDHQSTISMATVGKASSISLIMVSHDCSSLLLLIRYWNSSKHENLSPKFYGIYRFFFSENCKNYLDWIHWMPIGPGHQERQPNLITLELKRRGGKSVLVLRPLFKSEPFYSHHHCPPCHCMMIWIDGHTLIVLAHFSSHPLLIIFTYIHKWFEESDCICR